VATARGIRHQSPAGEGSPFALEDGLQNLRKHIDILAKFNLPTVVALNRFADDRDEDLRAIAEFCDEVGIESAIVEAFEKGGQGGLSLAGKVVAAAAKADPNTMKPLYSPELALEDKVALVAREIYGAASVDFTTAAKTKLEHFSALGFANLPICIAKTQYSLSDDPKKLGAPKDWILKVADAQLASGAGFIVIVAGNMTLMPGLPKVPQAVRMKINERGKIQGLY